MENEEKVHWLGKDVLLMPKLEGGLGIRKAEWQNTKQCCRPTQNGDSLWAKVITGIYYLNSDVLSATSSSTASWAGTAY